MSRHFSLRRRLMLSLFGVFLLGVAATAIYFRLEMREVQQRLRELPAGSTVVSLQFNQMVKEDIEFLGFILVPFTVAAIGVILFITQWSLRGLQRAAQRAAQIDAARLDERLDITDLPNEIVPVVRAINGSLDRLAAAYLAEQRLTANAAHELRTPLAVLQTRLQSAKLNGAIDWPTIEQDLAQLQRVIAQILDLARKESRGPAGALLDRQPVNLARVLREAAAQVLPLAERTNRQIEINAPDTIMVDGFADDLRDMLRNLLENALQHGAGTICGSMRSDEHDGHARVVVSVADEGAGIPASLHEAVFERFRKLSPRSTGAGLGLSIVRQVARDHGGEAWLASGSQATVRIGLPLSASGSLVTRSQ